MKIQFSYIRRIILAFTASIGVLMSVGAAVAEKVKVAGVYTLPVEQQWISRIHKALNAADARGEVDYTFSENAA